MSTDAWQHCRRRTAAAGQLCGWKKPKPLCPFQCPPCTESCPSPVSLKCHWKMKLSLFLPKKTPILAAGFGSASNCLCSSPLLFCNHLRPTILQMSDRFFKPRHDIINKDPTGTCLQIKTEGKTVIITGLLVKLFFYNVPVNLFVFVCVSHTRTQPNKQFYLKDYKGRNWMFQLSYSANKD